MARTGPIHLPGAHRGLAIGLFGGSFDPAHPGHLHVAQTALRALRLSSVWWLPALGNPLKSAQSPFAARFASAADMAGRDPLMRVSDIEAQLGTRYAVDTIAALKAHAPRTRYVWIMGADSLANFHRWKDWQDIAGLVTIAVVDRPGATRAALSSPFARRFARWRIDPANGPGLAGLAPPAWVFIPARWNGHSSTRLRAAASTAR